MTGALLIHDERLEQIYRHKRTVAIDVATNTNDELLLAADRLLTMVLDRSGHYPGWPDHWDEAICDKMDEKPDFEKIIIAGAFLAADLDRRMAGMAHPPDKQAEEFLQAARPLIEFLARTQHPHCTAIVANDSAELVKGKQHTGKITDYIPD